MNFEKEFLDNYLRFGLGSMTKTDIDALVMHLLDKYGEPEGSPLKLLSNQSVSEKLKTPVSKVKSLRYAASLKFSESIEEEAIHRFSYCLLTANFTAEKGKIKFLIEDQLAKSWFQGKLKQAGLYNDSPFNTEAIRVDVDQFIQVLRVLFPENTLDEFEKELSDEIEGKSSSLDNRKLTRFLVEAIKADPSVIDLLSQSDWIQKVQSSNSIKKSRLNLSAFFMMSTSDLT